LRTIYILKAITGNLDVKGSAVFFPWLPTAPYPTVNIDKTRRLGVEKVHPLFPYAPFPVMIDALLSSKPYQPKAMIVYQANPLVTTANANKVKKALMNLEFLVVFDIFKTATAELADIILPAASCFERDGYKLHTSYKGAYVALRQKVVQPVGESRSVFEVEYELARRIGFSKDYPWKTAEEWINYKIRPLGISVTNLREKPIMYVTPPLQYKKYEKDGFNTSSKKVEIYSDELEWLGYNPLPVYKEPEESPISTPDLAKRFPLVGTTRKPYVYVHSKFRNLPMLRGMHPKPLIRIHPDDAYNRGIKEDDNVVVESPVGRVRLSAKITEEIRSGVVVLDYGWGNPWDDDANVNELTSDEYRDRLTSSTPNIDFLCEVSK
jgi:anaerobic selenocysteine-containing dehydrogenase